MVWSDSDAGTADGKRDWVAAAMKHSMMLPDGSKPASYSRANYELPIHHELAEMERGY